MTRSSVTRELFRAALARRGRARVAGAIGLSSALCAVLAFASAAVRIVGEHTESPLPPESAVIEGTVRATASSVPSPVGAPFVYGRVSDRTAGRLHSELRGSPNVEIATRDGLRAVTLPDPSNWQRARRERGSAAQAAIEVIAVRAGDPIIARLDANGRAIEVWLGTRDAIEREARDERRVAMEVFSMIAMVLTVVAALALGTALRTEPE